MTQLLRVHSSGWERIDAATAGFLASLPTLAAGNMRAVACGEGTPHVYSEASTVVQVTTDRIRLVDLDVYGAHTLVDEWVAPEEIVHASVNETQIIVALSGGLLKMFVRAPTTGKLAFKRYMTLLLRASPPT